MATQTGTSFTKWKAELTSAEKELKRFWERGRRVTKRYMDEADTAGMGFQQSVNADRYNVFWSNVGILKSALYANPPKPLCKREFNDPNDQAGRVASVIMQRMLALPFTNPESDINNAFRQVVDDRLIPGLGQVWMRYDCEIEKTQVEGIDVEVIKDESVLCDYIYWEDFLWSPARTWAEVRWVARRCWMTKKEFNARFDKKFAGMVSWTKKPQDKMGDRVTPETMGIEQTEVFEMWDKTSKTVFWVSKSCDYFLDQRKDPLELEDFFPCPTPIRATFTTSSTIPKCDYLMVQTQYRRLDNLTLRIGMLQDAIQASGVYDKANKELGQILSGNMNKMIPVDNWAMFAEKGGLKGVVDWFPLQMIVDALDKLRELKNDAKSELFELTGISDIMRGQTNARETLGTQEMKSQYSSARLQYLQTDVSVFIQHALRIKAEIIAKHFQKDTILRQSLIKQTPDAELGPKAVDLLKEQWNSKVFRIQVFSHDMAIPDYNAERTGRTEFITAMGQFISQTVPLIEMDAAAAPFLVQMLGWAAAGFRSAQEIEGVFDKMLNTLAANAANPKKEAPDPKLMKAQADIQLQNAKAEAEIKVDNNRAAQQQRTDMIKGQADAQETHAKANAHITEAVTKAVLAALEHKQDVEKAAEKHTQEMIHTEEKHAADLAATKAKKKVTAKKTAS